MPNTYAALLKSIIDATAFAHKAENRKQIADAIAPANYLNQPVTVLEQILTGTYRRRARQRETRSPTASISIPSPGNRSRVDHHPDEALGTDQGRRRLQGVAEQVFLATDTAKLMKEVGLTPPTASTKSFVVMGKDFDPAKPDDYIKSFTIKRACTTMPARDHIGSRRRRVSASSCAATAHPRANGWIAASAPR